LENEALLRIFYEESMMAQWNMNMTAWNEEPDSLTDMRLCLSQIAVLSAIELFLQWPRSYSVTAAKV
jgi:hypothetical protein